MPLASWIVSALWRLGAIIVDVLEACALLYQVIWKAREDSSTTYRRLRAVGNVLLVLAFVLCAADWGWDVGLAAWLGGVAATTLFVALTMMPMSRWSLCVIPHMMVLVMTVICGLVV